MSEDIIICNKCKGEKVKKDFYIRDRAYACKECLKKAGRDAYAEYRLRYPKKEKPAATEKVCKSCGQNKEIDNFYTVKVNDKIYIRPNCKECLSADARELRQIFKTAKPIKEQSATIVCDCCQTKKQLNDFASIFDKRYEKYYYRKTCKKCLKTNKANV